MTLQRQIGFWLACSFGLALFLYLFHSVLTPFVAALILAYLLDPLVDRLEKFGMGRLTATCLVLAVFVLLFVIVLVSAAPFFYNQLSALITKLPSYAARIQALVMEQGGPLIERFGGTGRLKDERVKAAYGQEFTHRDKHTHLLLPSQQNFKLMDAKRRSNQTWRWPSS